MKYQCRLCIDKPHFPLSKYNVVPINDNVNESLFSVMDVVDMLMMTSFNDSYQSTNSLESYSNQHSDQSSNSSSNSISYEI